MKGLSDVAVEPIWKKDIDCPVCGSMFTSYNIRRTAIMVSTKDHDFCTHYDGINPLYFMIWVCPLCRFASLRRDDFEKIKDTERALILEAGEKLQQLAGDRDFGGKRDFDAALGAFELAVECYKIRGANLSKMAGLYLNMAWLCRTKEGAGPEEKEKEMKYTRLCMELYEEALQKQSGGFGDMGELGIQYLVGELHYNLGEHEDAIKSYASVIYSNDTDMRPDIVKMARDRWADVKEEYNKVRAARGDAIEKEAEEPEKPET